MTVFVDTSALYAVLDRDDGNHSTARRLWTELLAEPSQLLTSNYILVESTALLQHRIGLDAVRTLIGDILPVLRVEWVKEDDHRAASSALLAANRRSLSLVDCTTFELMHRLGIRTAFAFDRHFREQGFRMAGDGTEGSTR